MTRDKIFRMLDEVEYQYTRLDELVCSKLDAIEKTRFAVSSSYDIKLDIDDFVYFIDILHKEAEQIKNILTIPQFEK